MDRDIEHLGPGEEDDKEATCVRGLGLVRDVGVGKYFVEVVVAGSNKRGGVDEAIRELADFIVLYGTAPRVANADLDGICPLGPVCCG